MTPEEKIVAVADTMAQLIETFPWFAAPSQIPVFTERHGDIEAKIRQALGTLSGICVTVVAADADQLLSRNALGLALRVRLVAQIDENAVLNRGKAETSGQPYRSALAAATAAMRAIQRKPNGLDPLVSRNGVDVREHRTGLNEFELDEIPFRLFPAAKLVSYHVTAYTTIDL